MLKILKNIITKKSANLNSDEWCNLIFENKNKSYGAYKMRQNSNKRTVLAFGITIFFFIIAIGISAAIMLYPKEVEMKYGCCFPVMGAEEGTEYLEHTILEFHAPKITEEAIEPRKPLAGIEIVEAPMLEARETMIDIEIDGYEEDCTLISDYYSYDSDPVDPIVYVEEEESQNTVCPLADNTPLFPGGEEELERYMIRNLRYHPFDIDMGIEGRVLVQFTITEKGEIEQIKILESLSPACDREVVRMLESMPKWIPARRGGRAIATLITLPIRYSLIH